MTDTTLDPFSNKMGTVAEVLYDTDDSGHRLFNGRVLVEFQDRRIASIVALYPAGGGNHDYGGGTPTVGTQVLVGWDSRQAIVLNSYPIDSGGKAGFGSRPVKPGEKVFRSCIESQDDDGNYESTPVSEIRMKETGEVSFQNYETGAFLRFGNIQDGDEAVLDDYDGQVLLQMGSPVSGGKPCQLSIGNSGIIESDSPRIVNICKDLIWRISTLAQLAIQALNVSVLGNLSLTVEGVSTIKATGDINLECEGDFKVNDSDATVLCHKPGQVCTMGGDPTPFHAKRFKAESLKP